jgi:hypothetical protein
VRVPHLATPRLGVESARGVRGMTWEVITPEIKILQADSGFYWELWNNGEPILQSLKNYPRATVDDFIEWLRQDFAEIAVVPYEPED